MTESLPAPTNPAQDSEDGRETFLAVLVRRSRYLAAILLSAALVYYMAGRFLLPPPDLAGASLLIWPGSGILGFLAALVSILLAVALSMLLTHPDAPHTGMFCAFLGLGYLAIKGGTFHLRLREAQVAENVASLRVTLTLECVLWAVILLAAEALTRVLYYRFYVNTTWISRSGQAPALLESQTKLTYGALALGTATDLAKAHIENKAGHKVHPVLMGLGGLAMATALGVVFTYIFMQSELKGQTLFAAFISSALAVFLADLVFADAPAWFMWMSVPAAAAVGYLIAGGSVVYPGESPYAALRALPVDYVSAGVPGAIIGYYMGLQFRLHAMGESEG